MEENKNKRHNIDGDEIDLSKDDLSEKITFETANFIRRMCAFFIDWLLIIVIWYLSTKGIFHKMDEYVSSIGINPKDFTDVNKYNEFVNTYFGFIIKIIFIYIFVKSAYFCLIPAIIGEGRTLGKLLAGIGTVSFKTLEEVKPIVLIYREFICRGIIETLLVIPNIVSLFLAFFRKDSRCLHDLMANTVVIKLDLYDIE